MIDYQTKGRSKSVMKEALGSGSQTLKLKVGPAWSREIPCFVFSLTSSVVLCSSSC